MSADVPVPEPSELLAHCVAAAADPRVPVDSLGAALAHLFPDCRCDVLVVRAADERLHSVLTTVREMDAPARALASREAFVAWLQEQGFAHVESRTITDGGETLGFLVVARQADELERAARSAAGYLARALALRQLAMRREAEVRDARTALMSTTARMTTLRQLSNQATLAIGSVHDLGNTLALVGGLADLLRKDAPPELARDLALITSAVQEGGRIVDRVLQRQQVARAQPLPMATLRTIAEEVVTLTRPAWSQTGGINPTIEIPPGLNVSIEPTELREVLVNLVLNATKAMPEGGTLALRAGARKDEVLIEVSDSGIGIDHERIPMLLDPAGLVDPAQRRVLEPGGFGLPVSRALVEQAGGRLTLESQRDAGTTVAISLPRAGTNGTATGDREQGTGNREQGSRTREQGTGDGNRARCGRQASANIT